LFDADLSRDAGARKALRVEFLLRLIEIGLGRGYVRLRLAITGARDRQRRALQL
jgi:hypothetical protein